MSVKNTFHRVSRLGSNTLKITLGITAGLACMTSVASASEPSVLATLSGNSGDSNFGYNVAEVMDVNKDGLRDIAVAFAKNSNMINTVAIYSRDGRRLAEIAGSSTARMFGKSIASFDIDGDGGEELLIGDPGELNNKGAIHAYKVTTGATPKISILASAIGGTGDRLGHALAVSRNGILTNVVNITAGAPGRNNFTGAVINYRYVSTRKSLDVMRVTNGAHAGSHFGHALAHIGFDWFSQWTAIVAVGAPRTTIGNLTNRGAVHAIVVDAPNNQNNFVGSAYGRAAHEEFGHSVASGLDLNQRDGNDVVVGAPGALNPHMKYEQTGALYLLRGYGLKDWGEVRYGTEPKGRFGTTVEIMAVNSPIYQHPSHPNNPLARMQPGFPVGGLQVNSYTANMVSGIEFRHRRGSAVAAHTVKLHKRAADGCGRSLARLDTNRDGVSELAMSCQTMGGGKVLIVAASGVHEKKASSSTGFKIRWIPSNPLFPHKGELLVEGAKAGDALYIYQENFPKSFLSTPAITLPGLSGEILLPANGLGPIQEVVNVLADANGRFRIPNVDTLDGVNQLTPGQQAGAIQVMRCNPKASAPCQLSDNALLGIQGFANR